MGGKEALSLYLSPQRKQKYEGDWLSQSRHPACRACLEETRTLSRFRVQGREKQLGAAWKPHSCATGEGLCAVETRGTDHQDPSPRLRDSEESTFILGTMMFLGEDTKVLTLGTFCLFVFCFLETLVALRGHLNHPQPRPLQGSTMGFPPRFPILPSQLGLLHHSSPRFGGTF